MLNEIVPAGAPWCGIVPRGRILRITDLYGRQAVDFLCYNAAEPEEPPKASRHLNVDPC